MSKNYESVMFLIVHAVIEPAVSELSSFQFHLFSLLKLKCFYFPEELRYVLVQPHKHCAHFIFECIKQWKYV